jgi:uncharacterized protein
MQPIKIGLIVLLCLQVSAHASAQEKDDAIVAQAPGSFSLHGQIYHKHFKDAVPPASGYVTDWENLFTDGQVAHLDSLIGKFETATGIQIVIVTVDSSMSTKEDFDSVILRIAGNWGVGQDSSKGVVIGVSNALGVMRIQNGVGLKLSDPDTQQIVDTDFLPAYDKGQYYQGTIAGVNALMAKLQTAAGR